MINITITEETETKSEMADLLRRIADMIEKGYSSGYYPTWELSGDEENSEED